MSAVEGDRDGPGLEQFLKTYEVTRFVRQQERRQGLAHFRCCVAGAIRLKPPYKLVDRGRE